MTSAPELPPLPPPAAPPHRVRSTKFLHRLRDAETLNSLNERLRRGGSKRRLGLEAPNYLVVGIRESVLEETTVTQLCPGLIDALILAGLALRPPEPLSSRATRLGNDTLQPVVHPAPDVSVVCRTPQ